MSDRTRVPAVEGWFTTDDDPRLIGSRGTQTGSYFFPKNLAFSRNPAAPAEELTEVHLSATGRVWSWTTNHYQPPAPYIAPDPFVPYTVLAVELEEERMVVLGRLAPDCDPSTLRAGLEVAIELGVLFSDDERDHLVWQWRPVEGSR